MILEYKDWKKIYESKHSDYFLTLHFLHGSDYIDMRRLIGPEIDPIVKSIDSKISEFDISYTTRDIITIKLPEKYLENEDGITELEFPLNGLRKRISEIFMELSVDRQNYSRNSNTLQIAIRPEDATGNIEELVLNRILNIILGDNRTIDSLIREIDETLEEVGMSIAVGAGFYDAKRTKDELSDLFSRLIFAIHLKKDLFNKYLKLKLEIYDLDDISKEVGAMVESTIEKIAAPNISDDDSEQIIKTLKYLLTDLRIKGGKFARVANVKIAELIPHLNSAKSEKIQDLIQKATRS
jgi:hypothetical protein